MYPWNLLIDESLIASVLCGAYARFQQPVREGLIIFLSSLPEAIQNEIVARQAALAPSAKPAERLVELARCCPVLHKLGQTLARDARLAHAFRSQLRTLETFPPTVPLDVIQRVLGEELGPLETRGIRLAPQAIAEASVAVVIPFDQDAERIGKGQNRNRDCIDGVFKILKPGIDERLQLELDVLRHVGFYFDEQCAKLGLPALDYEESFQQIREKLRSEVHFEHEQRHLTQAAEFYADEPRVHIPALLPHCTPRVTAMERIHGTRITDHPPKISFERRGLPDLVVRALVAKPIFSRSQAALFHCDPHAGNLFLTDQGQLAVLDWSLTSSIEERERIAIVQTLLGALTLNRNKIVSMLESLATGPVANRRKLIDVVELHLKKIRDGVRPGLTWLIGLLDDAATTAKLRMTADMMLVRKALHILEGILSELGAEQLETDNVVLAEFLSSFVSELPGRWTTLPDSRDFATRLSNWDLAETALSGPATAVRFWLGQSADMLEAWRQI